MNILVVGLLLLAPMAPKGADGNNAAPQSNKEPRLDLYGDPLPDGAVARLGTMRMRHGHMVSGAVFSSDGKSIIASEFYTGIHVWDVAEGKVVRRFVDDDYYSHRLALSPDRRTLAVALGNLSVRLCDPVSGREIGSLSKDTDRLNNLVFSPDSSQLATGNGHKTVRIWDVATQRLIHELTFPDNVGNVAFSSDGKLLACNTKDGLSLWNIAQGKEVRQLKNDPDVKHSLYAIFSPNGGPMAVWGYDDASVRLFDANGIKETRRFTAEGSANTKSTSPWGWSSYIKVAFSPNGKILAVVRDVGGIELWDVQSGKKLHTLSYDSSTRPAFLLFSPDGGKLSSAGGDNWGSDNIIRVWDVGKGKEIHPAVGHGAPIRSVAISPNGDTIATAGCDGVIHLWERSSGKHLFRLEGSRGRGPQVSFSSDGQRVIWSSPYGGDGTLRIWNPKTGQALGLLELPNSEAYWTAVSHDGKTAFSVDLTAKKARAHDLITRKVTREETGDYYYHNSPMALSPAGDKLVGMGGTLMNAADRKELLNIGRPGSPSPNVWFSADGRRLVAAVTAKLPLDLRSDPPAEEIAFIDPIAGKELRRFGKPLENYYQIDAAGISRDGKTAVTVGGSAYNSDQKIITLWETETGRERSGFLGHTGKASSVAISADGRFIVTGASDTSALVWDATKPRTRNSSVRVEMATPVLADHLRDLAGDNAEQAYISMWALINAPEKTVSFLKDQNSLFTATDVQKIQGWIQDLDSNKFAERELASRELALILDEAEPYLKNANKNKASAEVRQRIDTLLQKRLAGVTGRELQRLRVIEVLEHIGGECDGATRLAGIDLLKKFAAGTPEVITQEAKASLKRLEK